MSAKKVNKEHLGISNKWKNYLWNKKILIK